MIISVTRTLTMDDYSMELLYRHWETTEQT